MKLNVQNTVFVDELYNEFARQDIPDELLDSKYIIENNSHEFHFRNTDIGGDLGDEFFDAVFNTIRKFANESVNTYDVLKMSCDSETHKLSVDIRIEFETCESETPAFNEKLQLECIKSVKRNNSISKLQHISIDTPCSVSDMEGFLHIVSYEGHWHDAIVKGEDGKIVIEFEVDDNE